MYVIFIQLLSLYFSCRYVADRLANEENQQHEQSQMQQSSSSEDVDMESSVGARSDSCSSLGVVSTDIDGGSIDELSAKFSVQGTSSSKSTGKKKVVSYGKDSISKSFWYKLSYQD